MLCSATGEGSVELPPGRYSVLATHGPEFDVVESTVDVSSSEGATFRARLRRSVKTDDWVAAVRGTNGSFDATQHQREVFHPCIPSCR